MKLMNCTPHKISIQDFITRVTFDVPCSGTTIRTRTNSEFDKILELPSRRHICINKNKDIKITNLPQEQEDVMLIMSAVTAADIKFLYPERNDIYSPDEVFRTTNGQIRYCKSLMQW